VVYGASVEMAKPNYCVNSGAVLISSRHILIV